MTRTKQFILLLAVLTLCLMMGTAQAVLPGDTVTVTLQVTRNSSAFTAKVSLSYDTNALEFVSASGANGWTAPQNPRGSFGIANADQPIATGAIGTVTFRVKSGASAGNYAVNGVVVRAVDTNYMNTTMQVAGETVSVQGNSNAGGMNAPQQNTTNYFPQATPAYTPQTYQPSLPSTQQNAWTSQNPSQYPCQAKTISEKVIVRNQPGPEGRKVKRYDNRGSTVTVTGEAYDSSGTRWYSVQLNNGNTGYIRGDLLQLPSMSSVTAPPANTSQSGYPVQGYTAKQRVNLRKTPSSTGSNIVQIEYPGTGVTVTGETRDAGGALWYAVRLDDGRSGYVRADLIQLGSSGPGVPNSNYSQYTGSTYTQPYTSSANTAEYGRLTFERFAFERGQKLNVYSAPSERSWRGGGGKASVGTSGSIHCAGYENGWYLIMYDTSKGITRVGYIDGSKLTGPAPTTMLQFAYLPRTVRTETVLSDDPTHFATTITTLSPGTVVTLLADYRRSDMTLAYIETTEEGYTVRGFVPLSCLD